MKGTKRNTVRFTCWKSKEKKQEWKEEEKQEDGGERRRREKEVEGQGGSPKVKKRAHESWPKIE